MADRSRECYLPKVQDKKGEKKAYRIKTDTTSTDMQRMAFEKRKRVQSQEREKLQEIDRRKERERRERRRRGETEEGEKRSSKVTNKEKRERQLREKERELELWEKEQQLRQRETEIRERELELELRQQEKLKEVELEKQQKMKEEAQRIAQEQQRQKLLEFERRKKEKEMRLLRAKPSLTDLRRVIFSPTNKFEVGELVLVPRSRGGFSYAKVTQSSVRHHCYLDPAYKNVHFKEFRVVYPNSRNGLLFKDLPGVYMGKLNKEEGAPPPRILTRAQTALLEIPDEEGRCGIKHNSEDSAGKRGQENLEGETIVFKGISSAVENDEEQSKQAIAENFYADTVANTLEGNEGEQERLPEEEEIEPLVKMVGARVSAKDLFAVNFSVQNNFLPDEIVIVPRSAGGFTYGKVLGKWECNCPLGAHKHPSWRVIITEGTPRIIKDLFSPNIGKLHQALNKEDLCPKDNRTSVAEPVQIESFPSPAHMNGLELANSTVNTSVEESTKLSPSEILPQTTTEAKPEGITHCSEAVGPTNEQPTPFEAVTFSGLFTNATTGHHKGGLLSIPSSVEVAAKPNKSHQREKKKRNRKPVVIIDGPNVAMKHGKQKLLSVKGIQIALDYYRKKGHEVICFLPQHYVTRKPAQGDVKLVEFLPMADNLPLLNELVDAGLIVLTPAQDYDDSYCIEYAKRHWGCIVTNDRYRDHVDKQPEEKKQRLWRWLRDHCISFTFVKDEFLPNPDFVWPTRTDKQAT